MKKLFLFAVLAMGGSLSAQSPDNGDYKITGSLDMTSANWAAPFTPVTSDPSGSCSHAYQIVIDSSGHMFGCIASSWAALNTGGLSGLTTNKILKACSATTGCNSALSDDGTTVTSTEVISVSTGASFSSLTLGTAHTPATSSESCTVGTFVWDTSYLYLCKASNTWVRSAWSTF